MINIIAIICGPPLYFYRVGYPNCENYGIHCNNNTKIIGRTQSIYVQSYRRFKYENILATMATVGYSLECFE